VPIDFVTNVVVVSYCFIYFPDYPD